MLLNSPGGDITFFESGDDGFTWPLPSGAGTAGGEPASIFSFEAARSCTGSDENGGAVQARCAEVPGGFPVVGMIALGIDVDTYEATLDVNVRVGEPLEVTGRTRLRASAVLGLVLDSVGFGIANAELGPVTVDRLAFVYEPPGRGSPPHEGSQFDVQMELSFETPQFSVAGRMIFLDGRFNFAGADVMFSPGILIYAGVFLNRFAGHFGINPVRAGGGLGASFASVLQINANWAYAGFPDGRRAMRGDGNATLAGGELANFHMDFWSDGFFSYSGRLGYSYPSFENPTFSLFGQTDFWVEAAAGRPARALPGRRRPGGADPRSADRLDARLHQQRLGGRLRLRPARHAQLPHRLRHGDGRPSRPATSATSRSSRRGRTTASCRPTPAALRRAIARRPARSRSRAASGR